MADGPAGFTQDFTCPALLRIPLRFRWLRVPAFHRLWGAFPSASTHHPSCDIAVLQPRRCRNIVGLGSSPFARHYLGNHSYFLFLRVLRCFSSPRLPPHLMRMAGLRPAGLPHSGTRGSRAACASPRLFAACRAFHRLPEPQASAVRPFLLSPAWRASKPSRRIPWLILQFSVESRFLLSSLLFQHVNDPFCHLCGNGWRITDSNR